MTIIVAAVDQDGVIHAGCDTNAVLGDDLWVGLSPDKLRLVDARPNDGTGDFSGPTQVLLGIAGRKALSQAIAAGRIPIHAPMFLDVHQLDVWAYGIAERLTEFCLEHELRDEDDHNAADFQALLGFHGQLWMLAHFQCDRFTPEPMLPTTGNDLDEGYHPGIKPGWAAVGSGRPFAVGAMHALYDHLDAEEAVDRALHAAAHDSYCVGPYKKLALPPVRHGALI